MDGEDRPQRVRPVGYAPPAHHRADVEVIDATELRRRVAAISGRGVERVDFHALLVVTAGEYEHMVDFEHHRCRRGSSLVVRPGEVHEFGPTSAWDGWLVIFRAEDVVHRAAQASGDPLVEALASLPVHARLASAHLEAVEECLQRMQTDGVLGADPRTVTDLLLAQVRVLALRLALALAPVEPVAVHDPQVLARLRAFRAAVDTHHHQWHQVQDYARHLGCSTKSLNRATRSVVDRSAKEMVVERIVLEAKRLLAHTTLPVATVGARLGFSEATNFVKFFRRETGSTPRRFRDQYARD